MPVPGSSLSPEELTDSVNRLEALIAENGRKMHEAGGKGIERLPGARELLDALKKGGARWGICTSGEPANQPSSACPARRSAASFQCVESKIWSL